MHLAIPKHLQCLALAAAGAVFALLGAPAAQAHTRITTDISWSSDIREILRQKCMVCHHPGGLAPDYVDFTRYGTDTDPGARAWAIAIEEEILTGRMPPWKPDPRFGAFSNTKALTEQEKEYIIAWVRGGAPQGPVRNLPAPEEFLKPGWRFGEPNLVFAPAEPFVLPGATATATTSYTFPADIEEDTWVTGYEFLPQNPEVIYSITAFIRDPDGFIPDPIEVEKQVEYDPLASAVERDPTRMRDMPKGPHFLGQWVRGDQPVILPDAGGLLLRKGSTIELRIQYERPVFATPEDIVDHSKLGLFLALKNEEIDLLVESTRLAKDSFHVKAGDSAFQLAAELITEENVHLIGINPHLGPLAKSLQVNLTYPDGLVKTAMWIPNYKHLFASSYRFEQPLSAPIGTRIQLLATYDNSEDNWDNPNSPPADVKGGSAYGPAQFAAWIDYTLDDHLIVQKPIVPMPAEAPSQPGMSLGSGMLAPGTPVPEPPAPAPTVHTMDPKDTQIATRVVREPAEFLSPEGKEIYWCPMRGNPCEVKDFDEPGECPECWMDLKLKKSFFEGKKLAPQTAEWQLTLDGQLPIYWCPNRGRGDHELVDYSQPASCPTCGTPLAHKSQFLTQHTWTCMTPTCEKRGEFFYGPGLCPACGQPVAGMGHMDHTPVHGGWQFFMADNLYHHLEGTMHEAGLFKLYFYDDWKVPLDARNFSGNLYLEKKDATTGEVTESAIPLEVANEGDTFLIAKVPSELPLTFYAKVWLAGVEKRYDFEFDALTEEPKTTVLAGDIRLHSHVRPPIAIPETVEGIVREIYQRENALASLIAASDWFALHYPAFDAKDFVAALADRQEGLNIRQRGQLKQAIGLINRGANGLDRGGDLADAPRVNQAYATLQEGVALLRQIYPNVSP